MSGSSEATADAGWQVAAAPYVASFLLAYVALGLPGAPLAALASVPLFVYALRVLPPGRGRTAALIQSALASLVPVALILVLA